MVPHTDRRTPRPSRHKRRGPPTVHPERIHRPQPPQLRGHFRDRQPRPVRRPTVQREQQQPPPPVGDPQRRTNGGHRVVQPRHGLPAPPQHRTPDGEPVRHPRLLRHQPLLHRDLLADGQLPQPLGARLTPDQHGRAVGDRPGAGGVRGGDDPAAAHGDLVGVRTARRPAHGVRPAHRPPPRDAAPVGGVRADRALGQRVLVEPAQRQRPVGRRPYRPGQGQPVQPGDAVGAHTEHVLGAAAGRQCRAEALAARHRRLQRPAARDRRADRGAGHLHAGVLGLADVEEVTVDPGDRAGGGGHPGHGGAGGDGTRIQQIHAYVRIAQVDGEEVGVGRAVGGVEVVVPVGDAGRDAVGALPGGGGRRAREGGPGQRAEDGELGEECGEPGSGTEVPVTRHEYPLGTGGCLAV